MINFSIAAAVCRKIFGGFLLPVSVLIIDNVEAEENLDTGGVALDGRYCIARVTARGAAGERARVTRRAPKGGVKCESIDRARSTCRASAKKLSFWAAQLFPIPSRMHILAGWNAESPICFPNP